jgi:hypothetical protein
VALKVLIDSQLMALHCVLANTVCFAGAIYDDTLTDQCPRGHYCVEGLVPIPCGVSTYNPLLEQVL